MTETPTTFNTDQLARAFLRCIQEDNGCDAKQSGGWGEPCRNAAQCGCWLEMVELYEGAA